MKPSISACALAAPLLLLAAADADARAADPAHTLSLPAKDLPAELVGLATATGISIGGLDPAQCHARPRALDGRYTAETALKTLLRGSACSVERIDPLTWRLVARPQVLRGLRPKPRPVAPLAPPPTVAVPGEPTLVVVRTPQVAARTAAGVSVVAPPLLSGNDTDLSRVAPHVSGMVVTNLGPGRDKIFLRGISDSVLTGRTQSTVGLYLDDTPITYNAPDPDLLLVDMARIEVLKGPQGNLYGQGALSGVVRLVTRAPNPTHVEGQAGVSLGVTHGGQPSWRVTGMANLPLLHGAAAVRAVLYTEKSGGFIKADSLAGMSDLTGHGPPPPNRRASNDTDRAGGRLAFLWQPSEDLTLQATATVQDLDSSNSQYVSGHRVLFDEPLAVAEPHDNSFRNLSFGVTRRAPGATFHLALNHSRHKVRTGYDARPIGRYVSIPNSGVLFYEEDQSFGLSTLEASAMSPRDGRFQWLAGLFLARSDETFTPHLSDIYTDNTLYDEHRADTVRDAALFGKLTWKPSPKWTLSAGLRVQSTRHATDSTIRDVHLTNYRPDGHIVGRIEATPVSHEVMAGYQANPRLLIYALAANGFRTGGFNTTTLINTAVPRAYAGDRLDSVEAGFKYRSADKAVALDMALFRVDWRDIQSDQLRATGLPVTLNIGDGVNTGLETELAWRVTPDLRVQLRGQLNQPKLRKVNPLLPRVARTGMPFIAKSSMSFTVQWDQALNGRRFNHVMVLSGRDGSTLNYGVTPKVWMNGYVNLDLSSATDIGPYNVGVRVTNALSTKSNSFAYGNPFSMDSASQITPLRPRTVWLSVSRSY